MNYCIYKTTNQINGKFYIGVHDLSRSGTYFGSGKRLLQAIRKYGKENFKQEILICFETKSEAFVAEAEIVTEDLVKDRMCYNMTVGGSGGAIRKGQTNSKEHNNKIRSSLMGNINGSGRRSEKVRAKISNARKGMKFSEETRHKMSESHKKWWDTKKEQKENCVSI